MIRWEQMVMLGNPQYGVELQPIDFAMVARACGGIGLTVTEPKACGDIIEQALSAPGPVLVEAVVDPYEPPLPGKITTKQACVLRNHWPAANPKGCISQLQFSKTRLRSWSESCNRQNRTARRLGIPNSN
jgi:hypothetical protein